MSPLIYDNNTLSVYQPVMLIIARQHAMERRARFCVTISVCPSIHLENTDIASKRKKIIIIVKVFRPPIEARADNGSVVMGQMGQQIWVGHGSVPVTR